jgi:2-octaprenyl-6-methoxyphenol hydroxylase
MRYDLAIVGGGMVGASLALALARTSKRVVLIEPVLPGVGTQSSFDDRTSALANGTRRVLETIGAWPAIASQACPIQQIQVSDAGHLGAVRLNAAEQGLSALGYTVANRVIGAALWQALRAQTQVELRVPARVTAAQNAGDCLRLDLQGAAESAPAAQSLEARLVVAADGAHSLVRQAAGIADVTVDYEQVAIVANLQAGRVADGIAYERFTPHGPLALLPLLDGSYTVVWTVSAAAAPQLMASSDAAFLAQLLQRFGWRIGELLRVGKRSAYPLALSRAQHTVAARTVLVGNAAQSLHPVAGQGFNLGLRDAAVLAELVAEAGDAGAPSILAEYEQRRAADRRGMIGFTDGLVRLFAMDRPGAAQLRGLGMLLFDAMPDAKRALSRVSWGFGARAPRLLRGLALT